MCMHSNFSRHINSETVAKFNSLNKECLAVGFQEDLD